MSEVVGWYAFFFFVGALLSGFLVFAALRSRRSAKVQSTSAEDTCAKGAAAEKTKSAWVADDLEKGEAVKAVPIDKLKETLRQLLESELANSKADVKADQLDRLTDKALAIGNLRAAAAASEAVSNSAIGVSGTDTRTPNSSDRSGSSTKSLPVEEMAAPPSGGAPAPPAPPAVPAPVMGLQQGEATRSEADEEDDESPRERDLDTVNNQLAFGPTDKQLNLVEPPERCAPLDQEVALHNSFATVQKVLHKRDTQTTELHKQLREARQDLWIQTTEARAASARLHELLTDPSRAPAAQAEALARLRDEASSLSSRLADAREQAKEWQTIARRQRAYFLQTENMGQESLVLLRKHPAGEVFVVPPPVASPFEEEDLALGDASGWNVGRSHCNPYEVDSWPFEPNVLAARASREPNLSQCHEGDEIEDDDDGDDALDAHFPLQGQRPMRGQRQPPCTEWSDDGEDEEEPLADDDDDDSPVLGTAHGAVDAAAVDDAEQSGESL